jgi:broad specificity phosphatase PhoE
VNQTFEANSFWKSTAVTEKVPFPQIHYVSPMTRTMQTANYTWSDNQGLGASKGFFVKEALREAMYSCTCSERHPKSTIRERFPQYNVDADMSEPDNLWKPRESEPRSSMRVRAQEFLTTVFSGSETFISATSHGVIISVILEQAGYPNSGFPMGTAQNIPLLVKGVKLPGKAKPIVQEPYAKAPTCGKCEGKAAKQVVF